MGMTVGAQLYTLRDYCRTPEDFACTLRRVADMGYTTVQVSGTCAYTGTWLRDALKCAGLTCTLTHVAPQSILDDAQAVCRTHEAFSCRYVGIGGANPWFKEEKDYEAFRDAFLPAARAIKNAGKYFMYHNHYMEFGRDKNGVSYFERMLEDFAPNEMGITLDTYWLQYAGGDSRLWLEKLKGRVPCVHLKDMAVVDCTPRMAPVGDGNFDYESLLKAAEDAGTRYLYVEQDDCFEEDPFDCLKKSLRYLNALGLK